MYAPLIWALLAGFASGGLASPETENLVTDPGFERAAGRNAAGWRGVPDVYSRDTSVSHSGGAALKYVNTNPKRYELCSQPIPLRPGRRYEISAWIKTQDIAGEDSGATVCLEWHDKAGRYLGGFYPAGFKGTTDWKLLHAVSVRVPPQAAGCSVTCYVRKGMTGTAWWDDLVVRRYREDPLSAVLARPNYRGLLTGPDPVSAVIHVDLNLLDHDLEPADLALLWVVKHQGTPRRRGVVRRTPGGPFDCTVPFSGLPPGAYTIRISLVNKQTNERLASREFAVTRAYQAPAWRVWIDRFNRLIVDGKPFFPLGTYWSRVSEELLKTYADSPFNCLMPYGAPNKDQLDLVERYGLKVIYSIKDDYFGMPYCPKDLHSEAEEYSYIRRKVEAYRNHPALLAWYLNDELSLEYLPRLKAHQRWLERLDPNHPTWVVLYQVGQVRDYLDTFDAIGTDPYPIPASPARRAADWTRRTVAAVAHSRPVWMVPQVFNWACYRKTDAERAKLRPPTLAEMRSMAWQCVTEGATGLVFYSFFDLQRDQRFPFDQQWPKVKRVAREIKEYIPVLLSVEPVRPLQVKSPPAVHTLTRQLGGSTYLVVVNDGPAAVAAWIRAPAGLSRPRVRLGDDTLTAEPNGVHRIALAPFAVKVLEFAATP